MKRKNQLEIYARRYHIQTVERVYDTRVKTTGQRQELKRYHQTYIQVTTEYKEKLKEVKEKQRIAKEEREEFFRWVDDVFNNEFADTMQMTIDDTQQAHFEYVKQHNDNALLLRKHKDIYRAKLRAHVAVSDLMLSNPWDWFITLTFDPKETDTADPAAVYKCLREWTKRTQRKYKEFRFLLCPDWASEEQGIHFHGVIHGVGVDELGLVQAVNPYTEEDMYTESGQPIYNITGFPYGYTTATAIRDHTRCAGYMSKYITKAGGKLMGTCYYFCSRGLNRPQYEYFYGSGQDVAELVNDFSEQADYAKVGEDFAVWLRDLPHVGGMKE